MLAVGIDLGTSNSAIALYRRGKVEVIPIEGRSIMPSCVAADPSGGLLVGAQAKKRAQIDPAQAVLAVKRHMGDRNYRVELAGKSYSSVDISSMILAKMVEAASAHVGEKVENAVISVPAYFTNNQKEDTRLAGRKAGLNVLRLIPEPSAAAIAYGMDKGRDQTILVYDFGGGTFDVSILKVRRNDFQALCIGGADNLGGEDLDRRLIDLIIARLRQEPGLMRQFNEADASRIHQQLKEAAEAAKKELSTAEETEVQIPDLIPGGLFHLTITRHQYEAAIADLVERSIQITTKTIRDAKLAPKDIARVVLVGGTTRVPLIQRALAEKIADPYIADNVDEVVAEGAAVMAANLSGVEEDLAPIEVSNVTAHSLGIRAEKDKFSVIIPRGTPLPTEGHKMFTTAREHADRTDVVAFQGEQETCSDNEQIGGFALTSIARTGKPRIDVKFLIDADDILTVSAVDLGTGRGGEVKIEKFEPKPYQPEEERKGKDLHSLRIAVSQPGCDNAGQVLDGLQLRYKVLKHSDFQSFETLSQFDLVFINCLADISQCLGRGIFLNAKKNAQALRRYVEQGGTLYVSDFALDNISEPFPGHITFGSKGAGPSGTATATVVDPELREQMGASCQINFNTVYAPVASVNRDCHVYLAKGQEPILVSFSRGEGHVIYTSFHNGVQVSKNERTLLACIILKTISLATSTPLVELAETANLQRL
jgi:molecular chaperone DnaK